MFGISWGGFNSLQIAALKPPALKAIISACSTDDRYADDVHYMGGCLLDQNITWASTMFGFNSRPPDPAIVGERWREMWFHRLEEGSDPWIINWLSHQRRDAQWQHGSVCENYRDVECAVYMFGGWADGYTNAIPRTLAGLKGPRKGLIGPWTHAWGQNAKPGPRIGWLKEALRWWDYWLKDIDTGIMDEPMLTAWMQDYVPPAHQYEQRPGRWIAEDRWPSPNIEEIFVSFTIPPISFFMLDMSLPISPVRFEIDLMLSLNSSICLLANFSSNIVLCLKFSNKSSFIIDLKSKYLGLLNPSIFSKVITFFI